jgi:hypothetical protein
MTSGVGVEMLSLQCEVKKYVGKINATYKGRHHLTRVKNYMFENNNLGCLLLQSFSTYSII